MLKIHDLFVDALSKGYLTTIKYIDSDRLCFIFKKKKKEMRSFYGEKNVNSLTLIIGSNIQNFISRKGKSTNLVQ